MKCLAVERRLLLTKDEFNELQPPSSNTPLTTLKSTPNYRRLFFKFLFRGGGDLMLLFFAHVKTKYMRSFPIVLFIFRYSYSFLLHFLIFKSSLYIFALFLFKPFFCMLFCSVVLCCKSSK